MSTDYAIGAGRDYGNQSARPVLLVDDDDLDLCALTAQLSAAGYEVTTAQNGLQAYELLQLRSFPVVITDYQMPVMDGLQLVDHVRKREADRNYFIVWSMNATQADCDRSFAHGADDHLSKRVENPELLSRVELGFDTIAKRECQHRMRVMRSCGAVLGRDRDSDMWKAGAHRLHTQLVHSAEKRQPLAVMMLHVERQLMPREKSLMTLTQFLCLVGAINSVLRLNLDYVLPLDASEGLVRMLMVLPELSLHDACATRNRLCALLLQSVIDEPSESVIDETAVLPDCSIGVAAIESWDSAAPINSAAMMAKAEQHMKKLAIPT